MVPPERAVDPGGRDGSRAPIPWDGTSDHGWGPTPWLPLPPEADVRNVAAQRADERSILHWYRQLLTLRRATPALRRGAFALLDDTATTCSPTARGDHVVVLAFGEGPAAVPAAAVGARVVACTDPTLDATELGASVPGPVAVVAAP